MIWALKVVIFTNFLHRVTEKIRPEKSFWLCKYAINKMKTKIAQIVLFHSKDFKKVTKM